MKIALVWIGKTVAPYLVEAVNDYVKRVRFYTPFEVVEVPGLKNTKALSVAQQRDKEGELLLKTIEPTDVVVLLDDKGRQMTSVEFAAWIEKHKQASARRLVFVVGGAYGFSRAVYDRANALLSLSKMTYSHQMVRLVFVEQLYRAHTITAGEPYHHEDSLLKQS
ncbi:MAG: 23S rRNA (pseudouridine(1915)-N(3))-methyltransferase RlmH [Paludibacteraceae bacterium]|nr:23S rRNA (pseudouridine(1915)-N(3))-methyltransferase RlmH [Paludibacteraceae bacterium]